MHFARRLVIAVLVAACPMAVSHAAGKQVAGRVDGNKFVDQLYGFSFEKYDNWTFGKVQQEDPAKPARVRFTLMQQNYEIPADRQSTQESFTPPGLGLWVDTTSLSAESLAAEISNIKSKAKWRKDLAQAASFIDRGTLMDRGPIQINGSDGIRQQYRINYEAQVYNRVTDKTSVITDALIGDLYVVTNHGRVYAFFFRAERVAYPTLKDQVKGMILTMDFTPPADSATGNAH